MSCSEGPEVVEEILSELLTQVCSSPAPASHSLTASALTVPPEVEEEGAQFDLCYISREVCELLNCFSLRPAGVHIEVCQVKCLEQKASGYCGHYALYFSLALLQVCSSRDKDRAHHTLSMLTHRESFWRRYWESIKQLLSQVSSESWWPWTREHVFAGEIERSYLRYLLSTELAHWANGRLFVVQYAYGLMQDSLEHIHAVQEGLNSFVRGGVDHLVLILGVTNHWVTLLAHRHHQAKIGLMYLDSNNESVLQATESDIDKLVEAREKKHKERKGVGYENWKRELLRQSLVDQRDVVEMLTGCLRGSHTLPREFVSGHWERLLSDFNKKVSSTLDDGEVHTLNLMCWLEAGYSVKGLRDAYVQPLVFFGVESLTAGVRRELERWAKDCSQVYYISGFDQLNGFLETVKQLCDLLSV